MLNDWLSGNQLAHDLLIIHEDGTCPFGNRIHQPGRVWRA